MLSGEASEGPIDIQSVSLFGKAKAFSVFKSSHLSKIKQSAPDDTTTVEREEVKEGESDNFDFCFGDQHHAPRPLGPFRALRGRYQVQPVT